MNGILRKNKYFSDVSYLTYDAKQRKILNLEMD